MRSAGRASLSNNSASLLELRVWHSYKRAPTITNDILNGTYHGFESNLVGLLGNSYCTRQIVVFVWKSNGK